MRNWKKEFGELPDEELDKVGMFGLIECTNGIIQYASEMKKNGHSQSIKLGKQCNTLWDRLRGCN